jgi:hypothetical protein
MQQGESGWDPGVKKFFLKILNSVALVCLWIFAGIMAGIYYELAFFNGQPIINNIIYYIIMTASLLLLIRYLYRTWKNG